MKKMKGVKNFNKKAFFILLHDLHGQFRFPSKVCALLVSIALSVQGATARSENPAPPAADCDGRYVILLHGLARTPSSMKKLEKALATSGYCVVNTGYSSTKKTIEEIVRDDLPWMVQQCRNKGAKRIDFVTHSLGGILVRAWLQKNTLPGGSRIVMISPPNHGSRIVDVLKNVFLFKWTHGPAGQELGTESGSLPNSLKPVNAEIGIIAGNRSFNPVFSAHLSGEDDGKVTVESAKLDEMADFLVVPCTHTFIMNDGEVIRQVKYFLDKGHFQRQEASSQNPESGR